MKQNAQIQRMKLWGCFGSRIRRVPRSIQKYHYHKSVEHSLRALVHQIKCAWFVDVDVMGSRVRWHSETTPWSRWSVACLATMWRGQVCPGFHDLVGEKCMLRQTWDERQSGCSGKAVSQGDFDNKNVFGSSVALISLEISDILMRCHHHFWTNEAIPDSGRYVSFTLLVGALSYRLNQRYLTGFSGGLEGRPIFDCWIYQAIMAMSESMRKPFFFLPLLSGSVFLAVYK